MKIKPGELEKCVECGDSYISLYPLIACVNHIDLEEVFWKEEDNENENKENIE